MAPKSDDKLQKKYEQMQSSRINENIKYETNYKTHGDFYNWININFFYSIIIETLQMVLELILGLCLTTSIPVWWYYKEKKIEEIEMNMYYR